MSFIDELTALLNKHSIENESNTPDFILAEFLRDCLDSWKKSVERRDGWYSIKPAPGWDGKREECDS